jgi:hypothetical protein
MNSKKKHIALTVLFTGIFCFTFAQIKTIDAGTLNSFLSTKTYIVLEDVLYSDFNANIEDAASRHWTITPYEIINLERFEKLSKNPKASFLMVVAGEYTGIKNATFNILSLMMGHASGDVNKMPDILSVPLSYYIENNNDEEESYGYKLGGILEGFQYAVKNILTQKVSLTNIKDVINRSSGEVKTKELWLTANDLSTSVNTLEKIKNTYPYKVVITSEEAIRQAIDAKRTDVVFLHKVGSSGIRNAICLKIIIACSNGKLLYGDYHTISSRDQNGLLSKDFNALR